MADDMPGVSWDTPNAVSFGMDMMGGEEGNPFAEAISDEDNKNKLYSWLFGGNGGGVFEKRNPLLTGAATLGGMWAQNKARKQQADLAAQMRAGMGAQNNRDAELYSMGRDAYNLKVTAADYARQGAREGAIRAFNKSGRRTNPIHVLAAGNVAGADASRKFADSAWGAMRPGAAAQFGQVASGAGDRANQARKSMVSTAAGGLNDMFGNTGYSLSPQAQTEMFQAYIDRLRKTGRS